MGLFGRKDKDVVAEAQEELARQLAAEAAAPPLAPRPPVAPAVPRPRPAAAPPPTPSTTAPPPPVVPPPTVPPPTVTSTVVTVDGAPASPDQLRMVEGLVGMDLDGDGAVPEGAPDLLGGLQPMMGGAGPVLAGAAAPAPAPGTPPAPPPPGGSRLARLERLAALRDAGALTDEEFAAEKQRLLDGP